MKYIATMSNNDTKSFNKITSARKWAESYGNTESYCAIANGKGKVVAMHRYTCQSGGYWYKAAVGW